jgi:hypothetical protein
MSPRWGSTPRHIDWLNVSCNVTLKKSGEYSYNLQSVNTSVNRQRYNEQVTCDHRRREDLGGNQPDPVSGFIELHWAGFTEEQQAIPAAFLVAMWLANSESSRLAATSSPAAASHILDLGNQPFKGLAMKSPGCLLTYRYRHPHIGWCLVTGMWGKIMTKR